jgi:hypothetical protein
MKLIIAGILGATVLLGACSKTNSAQETEVRAAVEAHLQKKSNLALNNMDMKVENVKVNGDNADAQVRFSSKQNSQLAVTIQYSLRRAGDHWEVVSSTPMGGDSHQSMGATAEGAPNPHGGAASPPTPAPEASH